MRWWFCCRFGTVCDRGCSTACDACSTVCDACSTACDVCSMVCDACSTVCDACVTVRSRYFNHVHAVLITTTIYIYIYITMQSRTNSFVATLSARTVTRANFIRFFIEHFYGKVSNSIYIYIYIYI